MVSASTVVVYGSFALIIIICRAAVFTWHSLNTSNCSGNYSLQMPHVFSLPHLLLNRRHSGWLGGGGSSSRKAACCLAIRHDIHGNIMGPRLKSAIESWIALLTVCVNLFKFLSIVPRGRERDCVLLQPDYTGQTFPPSALG